MYQQINFPLHALTCRCMARRGAVAHRHQIARADEQVGLAKTDMAVDGLRGVDGDEQRVAVRLDLGPLVRVVRILDREIVQAEFLLQLAQDAFSGLVQADPDETAVVDGEYVADRVEGNVATTAAASIGGTGDHGMGQVGIVHIDIVPARRRMDKRPSRFGRAELARLLLSVRSDRSRAGQARLYAR